MNSSFPILWKAHRIFHEKFNQKKISKEKKRKKKKEKKNKKKKNLLQCGCGNREQKHVILWLLIKD